MKIRVLQNEKKNIAVLRKPSTAHVKARHVDVSAMATFGHKVST